MTKQKNIPKKNKFLSVWISVVTLVFVTISTIAYSVLNADLSIVGNANFRTQADIRIVDFKLINGTNGGIEEYNSNYSKDTIISGISLPNLDSTVTYEITVTNFVNIPMVLSMINDMIYSNPDIEYVLTGMDIDDVVNGLTTEVFQITFMYNSSLLTVPNDDKLDFRIEFIFEMADITPPVITAVPNKSLEVFLTQGNNIDLTTYATAMDDVDGDVTNNIVISSSPTFNPNQAGTYDITYNVQDAAGNQATPLTITIVIWNFVKIANGQYHGIALGSNGSVWTWGYNVNGQRGQGNTNSASTMRAPTIIDKSYFGDLPVIDIAGGYYTSCAINSAGNAYCWGLGTQGAIGNGATTNQTRPTAVTMPSGISFTEISGSHASDSAACFGGLGDDGNVYTWGYGAGYRLGTGATANRTTPTQITTSGDIVQASQGNMGGAAVTSSGQVYVWGANGQGQLARGNTTAANATTSLPTIVSNLSDIKEINYGGYAGNGFITSFDIHGDVYAWGWNAYGSIGDGTSTNKTTPTKINGVSNVRGLSTGSDYSHYVVGDNLYSTGYMNYGEGFLGTTTTRTSPILSTMNNVAGNVGMAIGSYDNAWILSKDGTMVYGIGYCDTAGQEFGSTVTQTTSNAAVVGWSFTPPPIT